MAKKLDPQIKQDRAELRERRTQLRSLVNTHKSALKTLDKAYTKARAELETRISIITGRLGK
jgi:hypothetical protein